MNAISIQQRVDIAREYNYEIDLSGYLFLIMSLSYIPIIGGICATIKGNFIKWGSSSWEIRIFVLNEQIQKELNRQ